MTHLMGIRSMSARCALAIDGDTLLQACGSLVTLNFYCVDGFLGGSGSSWAYGVRFARLRMEGLLFTGQLIIKLISHYTNRTFMDRSAKFQHINK